jgi:hypothetical protein
MHEASIKEDSKIVEIQRCLKCGHDNIFFTEDLLEPYRCDYCGKENNKEEK